MTNETKIVPIEPTEEMLRAGEQAIIDGANANPSTSGCGKCHITAYKAMLEAAPDDEPIRVKADPDGQVWISFNAGDGRRALINLNTIVLVHREGVTRDTCLTAIKKAVRLREKPE